MSPLAFVNQALTRSIYGRASPGPRNCSCSVSLHRQQRLSGPRYARPVQGSRTRSITRSLVDPIFDPMTPDMLRLTALVAGAALLTGCASPTAQHDTLAADAQLQRELRTGAGYEHVGYTRRTPPGGTLHVYFDGDGTPWLQGRWPAADPTPRVPLTLELVTRDPHGAYLGRPCYLGAGGELPCTVALWTDARYGEAVVRSMTGALRALLVARRPERVVLIGYSGGGTLAMLVAERIPGIAAVVTIAANLDVGAWAQRHGYRPLSASLDPARRAALPHAVRQIHLVGGNDTNVPPALVRAAVEQQPDARVIEIVHYDHRCCWTEAWPGLLYQALGQAPAQ